MPSFLSRRYIRPLQAVGAGEKLAGLIILMLLAAIVAAYVWQARTDTAYLFVADGTAETGREASSPTVQPAGGMAVALDGHALSDNMAAQGRGHAADDSGGANPFPDAGIEGWQRPAQVSRFTPETLYQKIDGRADLYVQYRVVGLTFGAYAGTNDPDHAIDVYWYDMGEPQNALGIYRAESPEQPAAAGIGQQSYAAEGAVFFIKAGSYVQVLPAFPDAGDAAAALEIARRIAPLIEDRTSDLWALDVLPRAGRIEDSFEYLSENAFGLSFLSNVYTAEYDRDGGRVTLFVHRENDEAAALPLLDQYRAYFEQNGEVLWTDPDPARRLVAGQAFGVIDVVFAKGRYFGGASGADDLATAKEAATKFFENLSSP